jgi:hypothetical protein
MLDGKHHVEGIGMAGNLRRGIYRTKTPDGMEDDAQVQDVHGGSDMPLSESLYRERGYEPPYDDLLWRDDYFAQKSGSGSSKE